MNLSAETGLSVSIVDEMKPKKILDAIQNHRVTAIHAVPPIFQLILNPFRFAQGRLFAKNARMGQHQSLWLPNFNEERVGQPAPPNVSPEVTKTPTHK